jgi:septum formation protein
MKLVLASASPRRKELLHMLGLSDLLVLPAKGEEKTKAGLSPAEAVCVLSRQKAREVAAAAEPDALILAADTIVAVDGEILGKPADETEAFSMLSRLSGRAHEVFTGVTLLRGDLEETAVERTEVRFRALSPAEIRAYIATGEPMDKAGAYGAQGRGSLFVEGISGDFFNVVGLPLCRLSKMLERMGVSLL